MKRAIGILVAFWAVVGATHGWAEGLLRVELPRLSASQLKAMKVEVLRVDTGSPAIAYQGDASAIGAEGIELPAGTYQVFLEHQGTGLIVAVDNEGAGYSVEDGQTVSGTAPDIQAMVQGIQAKDRAEREAPQESSSGGGTLAVGDDESGEASDDFVPGDLLVKFNPGTTLLDRYRFLQALAAENRNKLRGIEVYRLRVGEEANLEWMIQAHADDPRIAYMEVNRRVSIPAPVDGDTRR